MTSLSHPENEGGGIELGASNNTSSPSTSTTTPFTTEQVFISLALFIAAGVAEIGGGYLVWIVFRNKQHWGYALLGAAVLFLYGVIPTFQPLDNFGRVYAVYGGFFIVLSYGWGWWAEGMRPDWIDFIATVVCVAAVCVAYYYPR
eukprot:PhF_6_TR24026/c0_g1_i2/m.33643/K09771/TC.SMR3; small multidrug resistance family-3 protein